MLAERLSARPKGRTLENLFSDCLSPGQAPAKGHTPKRPDTLPRGRGRGKRNPHAIRRWLPRASCRTPGTSTPCFSAAWMASTSAEITTR
jgi:hypothetical protein